MGSSASISRALTLALLIGALLVWPSHPVQIETEEVTVAFGESFVGFTLSPAGGGGQDAITYTISYITYFPSQGPSQERFLPHVTYETSNTTVVQAFDTSTGAHVVVGYAVLDGNRYASPQTDLTAQPTVASHKHKGQVLHRRLGRYRHHGWRLQQADPLLHQLHLCHTE